jgi:uncharacterized membrane protein YfcA
VLTVGLGAVLGFFIGLTGVGGGALVAPSIYVLLGTTFTQAVGLSLVYALFTKVLAFAQHQRSGNIEWRTALLYGLAGIPGALLGSALLYATGWSEQVFAGLMAIVLVIVGALMLLDANLSQFAERRRPLDPQHLSVGASVGLATLSFCVGVLLGITSIGSGSVIVLSMALLLRMSARVIVGTNIAISLIMLIPASAAHLLAGGVEAERITLLLVGSVVGVTLGTRATTLISDRSLRTAIAVLVIVSSIATVARAWSIA